MRGILEAISGDKIPDHLGLAYDRYAPLERGQGKIPPSERYTWLQKLANQRCAPDYAFAFERWRKGLKADGSCVVDVTLASRLLVGHGNVSPTEVGLTVHRTWGVPVIPGSALKGLLNHYIDAVYGPGDLNTHPMEPGLSEATKERARYRGVTWDKRGKSPLFGPGEVHRALFGAPATMTDSLYYPDAGETRGAVVFHDALYVPETAKDDKPFGVDVLTVHQKDYYNHQGRRGGPTDYDDPNPVSFLTVNPGAQFLIGLSGPKDWTEFALRELVEALLEWGVGGKTAAGYGRFVAAGYETLEERAQRRADEIAQIEAQRQEAEQKQEANVDEIVNILREISMSNAAQRLPKLYEIVSPDDLPAIAKKVIEKLTRKSLKAKAGKEWVNELFAAAGESVGAQR